MNTNQSQSRTPLELHAFIDGIPALAWTAHPDGSPEFFNQRFPDFSGLSPDQVYRDWASTLHRDDAEKFDTWWQDARKSQRPAQTEVRFRRADGEYRWFQISAAPIHDERGTLIRWCGVNLEIEESKRSEAKLRQSEEDIRTIVDAIRQAVVVLDSEGATLYMNLMARVITGLSAGEIDNNTLLTRVYHPDDIDRFRIGRQKGLSGGVPFELEVRVLHKDGRYRWFLNQYNPLKDERGRVTRWYVTGTDIEDQKKTEERLRNENLVLREDIDRSSMFEEIVGSCPPMRHLLKHVEKVAASDSTVLILGETGTGKELIARALHRRSKRANRAFVRVNCAAIPQSLIASELFGHEKGAFTGALQRRLGRFEAADGGTLFLDEIGELPMETQIALLRVLQEHEFERVGSNHPVSVDVRVIAATNRDLPAAVTAGTFRQDLFYRLNVFPITVPPLRERREDIPLLVEYFVGRFARSSSKKIQHIGKDTLEALKNYEWPGNIRELQNVVERAVILTETDEFVVDRTWLESASINPARPHEGLTILADREVEMIEAALAETHGRISGPSGAAAKLGIPRQTLESKIRRLGIDRYGQKRPTSR
jgi:formate hydrogenlyase transcriptional activator